MLYAASVVVLILITLGIVNHRKRKLHITLMSMAFLVDLALVLIIELNRGAIAQALSFPKGLLLFHILDSVLVLLLYVALIVLGIKWIQRSTVAAFWHRRLAYVFVVARLTNFVTSLMLPNNG